MHTYFFDGILYYFYLKQLSECMCIVIGSKIKLSNSYEIIVLVQDNIINWKLPYVGNPPLFPLPIEVKEVIQRYVSLKAFD